MINLAINIILGCMTVLAVLGTVGTIIVAASWLYEYLEGKKE